MSTSDENEEADIGVLHETEGLASDGIVRGHGASGLTSSSPSNSDTTDQKSKDEPAGPTTRWDVFQALERVITIPGNFCAGGSADGSTNITPNLPAAVGLRVTNSKNSPSIGSIPLPITDAQTQQLRTISLQVDDESFHNVRQIEPGCIEITNPNWEASLTKLLRTAALQLGVAPEHVRAELDALLMFERGSSIDRCCDTEEDDNVLGTLMIQLPSVFNGGEIRIYDDNADDFGCEITDKDDSVQTFDLGAGAKSAAQFSCHYLCHYTKCNYEMDKIKRGTRLILVYSLIYEGNGKPTACERRRFMTPIELSLQKLLLIDRILMVPLLKEYDPIALATEGINALTVNHRSKFETIRAAGKLGWKLMVIHATRTDTETRRYGGYSDGYREEVTSSSFVVTLGRVFDEAGRLDSSKNWLKDMLSFDACEGGGKGMVLAHAPSTPEENSDDEGTHGYAYEFVPEFFTADIWGEGVEVVEESECRYGRHSYVGDAPEKTVVTTYSSTFLLTYEMSCELEMMCVSGGVGLSEGVEQINRMGDEALAKCKRADLVNAVLTGRNLMNEPDDALFGAIFLAVELTGWDSLSESISNLFHNGALDVLDLQDFVTRMSFIAKLHSLEAEFVRNEVDLDILTEVCFSALDAHLRKGLRKRHPRKRQIIIPDDLSTVLDPIEAMADLHGWTAMVERVGKLCFDSMVGSCSEHINRAVQLGRLLLKLKSFDKAAPLMVEYLEKLVSASVLKLERKKSTSTGSYFAPQYHSYETPSWAGSQVSDGNYVVFMHLVFEHGSSVDFDRFGSFATSDSSRFNRLCDELFKESKKAGTSLPGGPLSLCFLNKCLLQQQTVLMPDMLEKFPSVATSTDSKGRIPLHHAAASNRSTIETVEIIFEANPKGGSIIDPITGLYPFQLAGVSENIDASFELLLADPSLVIRGPGKESKKRKRSSSMDDKKQRIRDEN